MKVHDDELGDLATHFERMKGELREKDKMQNEFIMVASHELRTPIQPILGLADLALKGRMETEDALKKIRNEATRLKRLADDILDVTRIEGGKMTYNMENVNVKDLLEGVIQSFSPSIPAEVSIVSDLSAADAFVKADRERLEQAFSNILGNAIKFTHAGKIKISCAKLESEKLEIRISDAGTGIPPEILPRLFEKFVTKDIGGNNRHGTGLGLFITRAIVQAHGGQIMADNQKTGGATFTVVLPASVQFERDISEMADRR
jgi:signal transduction histidine kinase